MDGDSLVIYDGSGPTRGYDALSVYDRVATGWQFVSTVPNPAVFSGGGTLPVRDEGRIAIGATSFGPCGSVFIAEEQGPGTWTYTEQLNCPVQAHGIQGPIAFGRALALDGDTLAVSAPLVEVRGVWRVGLVFIYEHTSLGWTLTQTISPPPADIVPSQTFGLQLALDRNTLAIAAEKQPQGAGPGGHSGSIYIYERPAPGHPWTYSQVIADQSPQPYDRLGFSMALEGDTLVAGKPRHRHPSGRDIGEVLIFERDTSGSWGVAGTLRATDGYVDSVGGDEFGYAVAIEASTIAVGSLRAMGTGNKEGGAYLFHRHAAGAWPRFEDQRLVVADGIGSQIGSSLALSDSLLAVGELSRPHPLNGVFLYAAGEEEDICSTAAGSTVGGYRLDTFGGDSAGSARQGVVLSNCPPLSRYVIVASLSGSTSGCGPQVGAVDLCVCSPIQRAAFGQTAGSGTVEIVEFAQLHPAAQALFGVAGPVFVQALVAPPSTSAHASLTNAVRLDLH